MMAVDTKPFDMATAHKTKTPFGDAPTVPIMLIGLGAYILWFGVHYWRDTVTKWPTDPIKDVLTGKGLPPVVQAASEASVIDTAIAGSSDPKNDFGGGDFGGGGSGVAIAQDALKYKGHIYKYGGAPGRDGKRPWDCSSFVNWVVGHDMKMAIPGLPRSRHYDGTDHGPATGTWLAWSGVKHITKGQISAGDIMLWQTHMGIAINKTQMISAQGPDGTPSTRVSDIHGGGPVGEIVVPMRLRAVTEAAGPGSGPYTHAKLESLWVLAGGSRSHANVAAAVAQAESGGRPGITSSNPDGGTNVGLWQLDTPGGVGHGHSIKQLKNALTNARITVRATNNGRNWGAWETYVTGAYRRFLQ